MKKRIKSILVFLRIIKTENHFFTKDYFRFEKFIIGEYTYGHPSVIFKNNEANLFIGKYCSISQNVTIFLGGNHRTDWVTTYPFSALPQFFPFAKNIEGHPSSKGDVHIGNDVWLGRGVTVLSGITISDGAVVAANSVVTKSIGPYEIWGGNPARYIKHRFDEQKIQFLLDQKWWNWSKNKIKQNIHFLCGNINTIIDDNN
jgi:acetyltransferase-like isoleucine patch superfamily enzyme